MNHLYKSGNVHNSTNDNVHSKKLSIATMQLSTMVQNPHILIIGKRGSGKSRVIFNIIDHLKDKIDEIHFISPQAKIDPPFDIQPNLLYHSLKDFDVSKFFDTCCDYPKERLVVFDDCLSKEDLTKAAGPLCEILFNGRHYRITYIITIQFSYGLSPELRTNFDYVFLGRDNFATNQKRMYDHYGGMLGTFDTFRQIHNELTTDFGFMVINNKNPSNYLIQCINYFKGNDKFKQNIPHNKFVKLHFNNDAKNALDTVKFMIGKRNNKIDQLEKLIEDERNIVEKLQSVEQYLLNIYNVTNAEKPLNKHQKEMLDKMEMLRCLSELAAEGIKISQNYDMSSDYEAMKFEYDLHKKIRENKHKQKLEKMEILMKLSELQKQGVKLSQEYDMNSIYDEMKIEYEFYVMRHCGGGADRNIENKLNSFNELSHKSNEFDESDESDDEISINSDFLD